jgi:hypothetical protein
MAGDLLPSLSENAIVCRLEAKVSTLAPEEQGTVFARNVLAAETKNIGKSADAAD